MKPRFLYCICCLSFFIQPLSAQLEWGLEISPGVTIMLNTKANLYRNWAIVADYSGAKPSIQAGLVVRNRTTKQTAIQAGLSYYFQSYEMEYRDMNPVVQGQQFESARRTSFSYHLFHYSLQIQYQLFQTQKHGLLTTLGISPSFAFYIHQKTEEVSTGELIEEFDRGFFTFLDGRSLYKKFLFPVHWGLQYRIPFGSDIQWEIGPRVAYDFSGILRTRDLGIWYNRNFLNFQLTNFFWF